MVWATENFLHAARHSNNKGKQSSIDDFHGIAMVYNKEGLVNIDKHKPIQMYLFI